MHENIHEYDFNGFTQRIDYAVSMIETHEKNMAAVSHRANNTFAQHNPSIIVTYHHGVGVES